MVERSQIFDDVLITTALVVILVIHLSGIQHRCIQPGATVARLS